MRWLTILNGLGVLAGAAYTGYAFTPSHSPLWAGIATLMFLVALFVPLGAEYGSLDQGFRSVGDEFVETRRREQGMGPKVEILTDAPHDPRAFRRSSRAGIWALALFLGAAAMLTYDAWAWRSSLPPRPANDVISNF